MREAGAALQEIAAGHVHLGAHQVAFFYGGHAASDRGHGSGKLVTRNQRRMNAPLRPLIPVVDVQVSAAHAGGRHLYQHLARFRLRYRHFANLNARRSLRLYNRLHGARQHGRVLLKTQTTQCKPAGLTCPR